jgi:hypothetical protein
MTLVDLITQANSIAGFAILMVTTAAGLGVWFHKRMKAVATDVSTAVLNSLGEMNVRVQTLEAAVPEQALKLENVERAVANLGTRMQTVEITIGGLPTREHIHELALVISDIKGDIGKLDERLKPIGAIADRLQQFQLNNGAQ